MLTETCQPQQGDLQLQIVEDESGKKRRFQVQVQQAPEELVTSNQQIDSVKVVQTQ